MSNETKKTMKERIKDFSEKHPKLVTGVKVGLIAGAGCFVGYKFGKSKMYKYVLPQDNSGAIKEALNHARNTHSEQFNLLTLYGGKDCAIKAGDLGELSKEAAKLFDNYDPNETFTHFICIGEATK